MCLKCRIDPAQADNHLLLIADVNNLISLKDMISYFLDPGCNAYQMTQCDDLENSF